jgi:hypothetical protein
MKNAQSIVSHTLKPFEDRLETIKCLNLLFSMLPPNIKNGISYSYIRNDTLFIIVVSNPFKSEINYKKALINELLEAIKIHRNICDSVSFGDIKIYVDRDIKKEAKQQILVYEERATGEFEILTKNDRIREVLEKIKETIKKT